MYNKFILLTLKSLFIEKNGKNCINKCMYLIYSMTDDTDDMLSLF